MSSARQEYRCSSCHRWQPMHKIVGDEVVVLLGARELTLGEPRPPHYVHVPTCMGLSRHELCEPCLTEEGGCLACMRAKGRGFFTEAAP